MDIHGYIHTYLDTMDTSGQIAIFAKIALCSSNKIKIFSFGPMRKKIQCLRILCRLLCPGNWDGYSHALIQRTVREKKVADFGIRMLGLPGW